MIGLCCLFMLFVGFQVKGFRYGFTTSVGDQGGQSLNNLFYDDESDTFNRTPQKKDTLLDKPLSTRNGTLDQTLELGEDVFQNITKDGSYLVYNAYIDGPRENWVRAVGFSKHLKTESDLRCLFWDTNMNIISKETKVSIQILPFHTTERYASRKPAYIILTPLNPTFI